MQDSKVDMYMMINNNNFPAMLLPEVRRRLKELEDERSDYLQDMQLKNPTTAIILSVLVGGLGVDRFYIGDTGLGVAKLLTCGGLGIWTVVDWFMIMKITRERNYDRFRTMV